MGLTGCLLAAILSNSPATIEKQNIDSLINCEQNTLLYEESVPAIDYRVQSKQQFSFSGEGESRFIELIDDGFRWEGKGYEFELNHGRMGKHRYNPNPFGFREERKPHEPKGPRGVYILFKKEF